MKIRTYMYLFAAVLVLTGTAACAKKEPEGGQATQAAEEKLPEQDKLFKKAAEKLRQGEGFCADLKLKASFSYEEEGTQIPWKTELSYRYEADKGGNVHVTGTMGLFLGAESVEYEAYVIPEGKKQRVYTRLGDVWSEEEQELSQGDLSGLLETLAGRKKEQIVSATQVPGVFLIQGSLPADKLPSFPGISGREGTAAYSVWLYEDGTLKTMWLDLTDAADDMPGEGADIKELRICIDGPDTGFQGKITLPEAVKQAAAAFTEAEAPLPEERPSAPSDMKADEEGYYTLGNPYDAATVKICTPRGFFLTAESDKDSLCFAYEGNDSIHTLTITYRLITEDDNYREEDLAAMTDRDYMMMLSGGDYAQVRMGERRSGHAAGKTIGYNTLDWLWFGSFYGTEIDVWTVYGDGRMVRAEIKERSYREPCTLVDEDRMTEAIKALE